MLKGILIKATGEIEQIEYEDTLEKLHEIVGGYIEYVMIGDGIDMIVNEEGKIIGLEYNEKATNLFDYDIIVGDALVVGTKDGENISLTDDQIKKVMDRINGVVYE